jgi:hypothetical protein
MQVPRACSGSIHADQPEVLETVRFAAAVSEQRCHWTKRQGWTLCRRSVRPIYGRFRDELIRA